MRLLDFLTRNSGWLGAGVLLTFMSSFGQTFFISIFAGEIRSTFGLSHGQWGGIYTIGTSASALLMVWAGGLTDRFRVRTLGPVVLVLLALACAAMAINSSAILLVGVIFTLRFAGQGMSSHIAMVGMARWFVATRGRALSIASLGVALGEAALPVGFVALMGFVDWRLLWLVAASIALAGILPLSLMLRRERTPQSMAGENSSFGMQGRHWTRRETLHHPLFWFMVPALLGPAAFNTAFFFHQVHFAELKGWAHLELVAFFPLYTGMSIGAMLFAGWALDRVGTARLMPFYQLPMVIAFLAFSAATEPMMAWVGFLFMALATGAHSTLPNAFWAEFYGTAHIGSIKAMAAAVMVFGTAIGPGLTGILIDNGIGLEAQFVGVAGYFVFVTAVMWVGISRARGTL